MSVRNATEVRGPSVPRRRGARAFAVPFFLSARAFSPFAFRGGAARATPGHAGYKSVPAFSVHCIFLYWITVSENVRL